jgi:hypothetical protein
MEAVKAENGLRFIQGVKSKNLSIKILQYDTARFLVERKTYFLSICIKKESYWFDSLHNAEDKYLLLRHGIKSNI